MAIGKKIGVAGLTIMLCFGLGACKLFTVVPIDNDNVKASTISSGEKAVDVSQYVDEKWDLEFLTEIEERQQELSELLSDVDAGGWGAVQEAYGLKKGDIGAKYNYIVFGEATVKEVNTQSKAGYLLVTAEDVSGHYTVKISIGPVLKGTAIRDSLKCINFNEFVNQMDYANLANELNKRANAGILETVNPDELTGRTIHFVGSFTEPEGSEEIAIMPIFLEVQ